MICDAAFRIQEGKESKSMKRRDGVAGIREGLLIFAIDGCFSGKGSQASK